MYNTNDEILTGSQPRNLPDNTFKKDIEEIIDSKDYHSDERSETDVEKVQEETEQNIRPKKKDDNHVIRVYDKPWRSKRVREYILII